ncbi:cytochrome P450 [Streptomyces syringium]|uniref:cytochrome P450 n=1 Tax=Streptomyces syringium TaxID=76729 RepID=UPI00340A1507
MTYLLLIQPELMGQLRKDYLLTRNAIEELFRWIPHENGIGQPCMATGDVEVSDVLIRAGKYAYVSYAAANRDTREYPQAQRINFYRLGPPHLAFGHDPNSCVGSTLARVEAHVLLPALIGCFPRLRLAVAPSRVQWQTSPLTRGPVALPATW